MSKLPVFGPKPRPGDKERREAVQAIYDELPKMHCMGLCAESCGPIFMTRIEWQRVCRTAKSEPKATGLECPLLRENRCMVYEVRPVICRLWGMVDSMPCPWGCKPERYLTEEEGYEFMARIGAISDD